MGMYVCKHAQSTLSAYRRDGDDRRLGDRRVQLHVALLKVVHVDLDAALHGDLARGRHRERVDRAPAARPADDDDTGCRWEGRNGENIKNRVHFQS